MKKVIAIVQARMGSTRLPGKVMLDLIGKPMLVHEIERILRSHRIHGLVVATTNLPLDDPIAELCSEHGWNCFRGDQDDVLDRYYRAAAEYDAEAIVRLTADCPLIEPSVIDHVIETFCSMYPRVDYASNVYPARTFPRGLDTEIMSRTALDQSWKDEKDPALREHVTQHILKNPDRFHIASVTSPCNLSNLRWTVDTPKDFAFVKEVYTYFKHNRFSFTDVLTLIKKRPDLPLINQEIRQKVV